MNTRRRAAIVSAAVIAVVLGCRALAPAQVASPGQPGQADAGTRERLATEAPDGSRADGGRAGAGFIARRDAGAATSGLESDGGSADTGVEAGAFDGGPDLEAELLRQTEQLRQQVADSDSERAALEEQVAVLEGEVAEIRAEEQRAAESRERRISALEEVLDQLGNAEAQLVEGTFDAQAGLDDAEAALAESLEEARTFGSGFEISLTERALAEARQARAALGRRDFYEAMRLSQAAAFDARGAFDAARSTR